ncbi:MAG: adenylyltransferase/cytidyltransferase family protein [Promethearchaeota archaeon]
MREIPKKVMVAGTFDIIHPGHIFLFKEAAKYGEVYVVVSTDKNAERFKGQKPIIPEDQRLEVVQNIKNVKKAILGRADNNTLKTVEEIDPDIILLGPDQKYDENTLKKGLEKIGLGHIEVKRLTKYYDKYELHSSRLIKKKIIEEFKNKEL